MSQPWPPPPDIDSIQELVATADVEGFIAEGSPADEYETEAEFLFNAVENFPTADILAPKILAILDDIWRKSFSLDDADLSERLSKMDSLAAQFVHFFGAHND